VTADNLCSWLERSSYSQRDKLAMLRSTYVTVIRELADADHKRVIRAIRKRLNSPKLATEVAALIAEIARVYGPEPVDDPTPAPATAPAAAPPPTADDDAAELVAAIAADPGQRDNYVVYGDWLQSRGDPRGELIAIGAELAKNPGHARMQAAHDAHLAAHPELLGAITTCEDIVTGIEWFMGFVTRCRVSYSFERFNRKRPHVAIDDVLRWLLDAPGPARFLQHLTIGMVVHDDNHYDKPIAALAACPRPALRTLFVGDFDRDECELNWAQLGDLSALWPAVPGLRELTLRGGSMTIGPISLPKLERLTTITGGLDPVSLGHIATADWPCLTHLSLQVGRASEGAAQEADALEPVLAATRVPKLRSLGILNCEFTDDLCERLTTAPVVAQLEELDLGMGTMSDAGAEALARAADRLRHLQLNVDDNYLTAGGRATLERCFPDLLYGAQRVERPGRGRYASAFE